VILPGWWCPSPCRTWSTAHSETCPTCRKPRQVITGLGRDELLHALAALAAKHEALETRLRVIEARSLH